MANSLPPLHRGAASGAFYEAPGRSKYPRLQILTIAQLLEAKKIDMPAWAEHRTFKKAPRARSKQTEDSGLPGVE